MLRVKKRLKTAKSGHNLLKEKLDGLMQEFLGNIKILKSIRENLEKKIPFAFFDFFCASNMLGQKRVNALVSHFPLAEVGLSFSGVMGVTIRKGELNNAKEIEKTALSFIASDARLYNSRKKIVQAGEDILKYANLTIKVRLLAEEIEKTRRRVNSLEYVYIPEMFRIKKYISQKLEERERFDRTIILKLKETQKT